MMGLMPSLPISGAITRLLFVCFCLTPSRATPHSTTSASCTLTAKASLRTTPRRRGGIGWRLVEGRSNEDVTIPKLGEVLYAVKGSTTVLDLLDQVFNFSASSVSYRVSGVAYLGRFFPDGVPYDKSGRIRLLDGVPGGDDGSGGTGGVRTLAPQ